MKRAIVTTSFSSSAVATAPNEETITEGLRLLACPRARHPAGAFDLKEPGNDYNKIKYDPLGSADGPKSVAAYLEDDQHSPNAGTRCLRTSELRSTARDGNQRASTIS